MLKTLLLRNKLDTKKKLLEKLRAKTAEFQTREDELTTAINEMDENVTEEDRQVIETKVEELTGEKENHEAEVKKLEDEIAEIEKEISETEEKKVAEPSGQNNSIVKTNEEREDKIVMNTRKFYGMNLQERDAFFANDEVKNFLKEVRTCMSEKRAITNVGLTIPTEMLPLIKEVVETSSKLLKYVTKRTVGGNARQRIQGKVSEAVWTEMCAKLNEITLGFNETEVDGYKVGAFFAVCNAILEDNDVALAKELIDSLGYAIALAIDKAIVYGKGTKMPLGIVTRLAQTVKPDGYSDKDRPWVDLHEKNILTGTGATGLALFKEIANATKVASNDFSNDALVWLMHKNTRIDLMVNSMDKNMSAAIVAGMNNTMPVVGGDIVELSFIPEGDIVFGYLDAYLLAERAGTKLGQSEHVKFIDDQTVFKGTARYDGKPVIAEAFGVLSIAAKAPTTTVNFAADTAN